MKCENYRKAIAAEPSESFAHGAEHADHCAPCSIYRNEILELDSRIAAALTIDVPPLRMPQLPPVGGGTSSKVVDIHAKRPGKTTLPSWIGIAAVLIVAAFLGTRFFPAEVAPPAVAQQVIAHMDHEQGSRRVTSVAVSERALGRVLGPKVSAMDAGSGLITYARNCIINNRTVPHLVVQGEHGPVTLILMPEEKVDRAIPLSGENVHGVIIPVSGGSVAVIAEREKQLNEVERIGQRLAGSTKWRT